MRHSLLALTLVLAPAVFAGGSGKPATKATAPAPAPAAAPAGSTLNQQAIHMAYNEGDFDKVQKEIETFTAANKTYSRVDSIFIAKHLAVVYTANPNSREKGKYYMYKLLEMMPSAELVDMFVSDEIDRIFEKVRKEFVTRQHSNFGVDTTQIALPEKPSAQPAPAQTASAAPAAQPAHSSEFDSAPAQEPLWKKKAFWIAGGAGVAVGAAIITFVSLQDEPASGHTYVIPNSSN